MTAGAEILRSFVADAREQLDRIQHQISSFAGAPGDLARLNAALPAVRAIKTASVFLGLRGPGSAADSLERAVRDVCRGSTVASRRESLLKHVRQFEASLRELELGGEAAPPAAMSADVCPEPEAPPALRSCEPGEAGEPDETRPHAAEPPGRGRALVVDGSRFVRHLVAATLEREHFSVETAETLAEAVALCERDDPFDLIVADAALWEASDGELVERLRARSQTNPPPLVGLMAPGAPPPSADALAACFDRVLTRFDTREFLAAVEELLPPPRTEAAGDGSLQAA